MAYMQDKFKFSAEEAKEARVLFDVIIEFFEDFVQ